ncbi:hypothetical protein CA223_19560 [Sphingomonas koreensis]|uniref:Uncharacterized protein n=2 Tax=Sphingomonas koreensis TaxID=93064 RepID=A0A1L6JCJ5_9SPHN|nr:hypothetical protein BRX40_15520 [Sphingomonas koreensis]RSU25930.1 hypothetical protein CA222_10655 [Sphingomonas koreensis]RSU26016.1 hypothetical protein CA222_11160 [Sphingomonas koreensis]RSU27967.1 hypothetical protein CA225_09940 [Sphingomonas koreensis]RSU28053.1 hypothetical protein CA225_10445 [Sphingomonas koreensis]
MIVLGMLAACKAAPETNQATPAASAPVEAEVSGVTRTDVAASPTPVPAPQAAIRTEPGPQGSQVALNKVAVTGDVMTVQLSYTGGTGSQYLKVDDISVIDDASARQLGVLKDASGKPLAAPLSSGSRDNLSFALGRSPQIVWLKFPAPPATSKTVSINLPGVVPFDGVLVTR